MLELLILHFKTCQKYIMKTQWRKQNHFWSIQTVFISLSFPNDIHMIKFELTKLNIKNTNVFSTKSHWTIFETLYKFNEKVSSLKILRFINFSFYAMGNDEMNWKNTGFNPINSKQIPLLFI